ncbi:MAG: 50S ribosomal protein L15 [Nitrospirales bacterium]|nr:50S ribosomal protein L15 [Nitrospirales bacterium]
MKLSNLGPNPGEKKKKRRIGRGPGSGRGKTAGKGHKGLLARSGRPNQIGFEGGQMPLARRLPKRGFTNIFRTEYTIVNLKSLSAMQEGVTVNPDLLRESGLVKGRGNPIKILGDGDLHRPLVIEAHKFSKVAQKKIEQIGGQAKVIGRA